MLSKVKATEIFFANTMRTGYAYALGNFVSQGRAPRNLLPSSIPRPPPCRLPSGERAQSSLTLAPPGGKGAYFSGLSYKASV